MPMWPAFVMGRISLKANLLSIKGKLNTQGVRFVGDRVLTMSHKGVPREPQALL